MERPNWDEYFINVAEIVASRSTCLRANVGAVIVKDKRILSTGYNGAPPGEPHCTEVGCDMVNGHCQRTIHAETNAVAQAARFGIPVEGAILYFWGYYKIGQLGPVEHCPKCSQLVKSAGILKVISVEDIIGKESKAQSN